MSNILGNPFLKLDNDRPLSNYLRIFRNRVRIDKSEKAASKKWFVSIGEKRRKKLLKHTNMKRKNCIRANKHYFSF